MGLSESGEDTDGCEWATTEGTGKTEILLIRSNSSMCLNMTSTLHTCAYIFKTLDRFLMAQVRALRIDCGSSLKWRVIKTL